MTDFEREVWGVCESLLRIFETRFGQDSRILISAMIAIPFAGSRLWGRLRQSSPVPRVTRKLSKATGRVRIGPWRARGGESCVTACHPA